MEDFEFIKSNVKLKKMQSPNNWQGFCPFYAKDDPSGIGSFIVNTKKEIFHCYHCNIGGEIKDFKELLDKNIHFVN